jgi:HAD superfamily hydrolase (TIGR01490 family)
MNSSMNRVAAFFDLDGTIYNGILYQGVFRHHREHGIKAGTMLAFMLIHLPLWLLSRIRLFPLELLYRMHGANLAWLFGGISVAEAEAIWEWVIETTILPNLRPEMVKAVAEHRENGHRLILLSGSFQPLLDKIVDRLDFNDAVATPLRIRKGRYTGWIERPVSIGRGKLTRMKDYLRDEASGIDLAQSYYYADSIADVACLEIVGNPVAVYPEESLATIAKERGWAVIGRQ